MTVANDLDELRRLLAEAGIPTGGWTTVEGGERPIPPALQRQVDVLRVAKDAVEAQVVRDRAKVAELRETLNRLKHGGGR